MSSEYPRVTIPNSEVRTLESSIVNDTYRLNIILPFGYEDSDETYPVVYTTDGNTNIFSLAHIVGALNFSQELPSVILVGIGYPTDDGRAIFQLRARDHLSMPNTEDEQLIKDYLQLETFSPGGANNFLRFIREELQPLINDYYRTKPDDQTYIGFSSGGLFGLYALFNHPDTFNRYIIGSPPVYLGDKVTFTYERNYAGSHNDLPVKMFLSVGGQEDNDPLVFIKPEFQLATNVKTMAKTLQNRQYPTLDFTFHLFEGETHLSVIPATFSRGLRTVFS